MDPKGYFKLYINLDLNQILISHFENQPNSESVQKPTRTFIGTTAESLYKEIIKAGLVSRLDHAGYLGKELQRAELALKFGIEYIQE
jgi:tetrahydromethanopterin S-methyltransferase subunit A